LLQVTEQLHLVEQYESKLTTVAGEVRRLNEVLGAKIEEIKALEDRVKIR
jgi:hypothetical protein